MVKIPLTMEYALLGFLRQRPMHAYEMHQTLMQAEALGLVWRVKQSQLYALITRLEDEGYVTSTTEPQDTRPARKILHLTPAGTDAFAEWVRTPVAHGRDFRLEFLAKLFFASQESPATLVSLIAAQRRECTALVENLSARVDAVAADRPFDRLVLRFRVGQLVATQDWLDECAQTLVPSEAPMPGPHRS
jgi:PadR family transcriptional regulator, regulatory protein AphA